MVSSGRLARQRSRRRRRAEPELVACLSLLIDLRKRTFDCVFARLITPNGAGLAIGSFANYWSCDTCMYRSHKNYDTLRLQTHGRFKKCVPDNMIY